MGVSAPARPAPGGGGGLGPGAGLVANGAVMDVASDDLVVIADKVNLPATISPDRLGSGGGGTGAKVLLDDGTWGTLAGGGGTVTTSRVEAETVSVLNGWVVRADAALSNGNGLTSDLFSSTGIVSFPFTSTAEGDVTIVGYTNVAANGDAVARLDGGAWLPLALNGPVTPGVTLLTIPDVAAGVHTLEIDHVAGGSRVWIDYFTFATATAAPSSIGPALSFIRTTVLGVTANTLTPIPFGTANGTGSGDYWAAAPNPSRVTIPAGLGGLYMVELELPMAVAISGHVTTGVRTNGAGMTLVQNVPMGAAGTTPPIFAISGLRSLLAGDYLEAVIESSAACQVSAGFYTNTVLRLTRMRPGLT